ncbi:hypothetical protein HY642_01865, partial [Candidatus Woesearchaeota archaeon]|nr:hypothetical protein [Candidatus Woesearchaeota archaeon]
MNSSRKSQLTIFIILGILMLLLIGTFVIIATTKKAPPPPIQPAIETATVQSFVERCLADTAKPFIEQITWNGGTLNVQEAKLHNDVQYPYVCLYEPGKGCVNKALSRKTMEAELDKAIAEKLPDCLNFSSFEQQGFTITKSKPSAKTTIAQADVLVKLDMNVVVQRGTDVVRLESFTAKYDWELGLLHNLAAKITSDEITNGRFDSTAWMLQHGKEVEIEQHKPYPDTVYTLTRMNPLTNVEQVYHFAIQGFDTVALIGQPFPQTVLGELCVAEKDCYANTPPTACAKAGKFAAGECETFENSTACAGGVCLPCGARQHGESWCDYDGIIGQGMDLVGSRHYRRSCVDGYVYT